MWAGQRSRHRRGGLWRNGQRGAGRHRAGRNVSAPPRLPVTECVSAREQLSSGSTVRAQSPYPEDQRQRDNTQTRNSGPTREHKGPAERDKCDRPPGDKARKAGSHEGAGGHSAACDKSLKVGCGRWDLPGRALLWEPAEAFTAGVVGGLHPRPRLILREEGTEPSRRQAQDPHGHEHRPHPEASTDAGGVWLPRGRGRITRKAAPRSPGTGLSKAQAGQGNRGSTRQEALAAGSRRRQSVERYPAARTSTGGSRRQGDEPQQPQGPSDWLSGPPASARAAWHCPQRERGATTLKGEATPTLHKLFQKRGAGTHLNSLYEALKDTKDKKTLMSLHGQTLFTSTDAQFSTKRDTDKACPRKDMCKDVHNSLTQKTVQIWKQQKRPSTVNR